MAKRERSYYRRVEKWEDVGMVMDLALLKLLLQGNAREGRTERYIEVALPVAELHRRLGEPSIAKSRVAGRMSSLRQLELVVAVTIFPTAAGKGYQITKKGEGVLKEHGDKLNKAAGSNSES